MYYHQSILTEELNQSLPPDGVPLVVEALKVELEDGGVAIMNDGVGNLELQHGKNPNKKSLESSRHLAFSPTEDIVFSFSEPY